MHLACVIESTSDQLDVAKPTSSGCLWSRIRKHGQPLTPPKSFGGKARPEMSTRNLVGLISTTSTANGALTKPTAPSLSRTSLPLPGNPIKNILSSLETERGGFCE